MEHLFEVSAENFKIVREKLKAILDDGNTLDWIISHSAVGISPATLSRFINEKQPRINGKALEALVRWMYNTGLWGLHSGHMLVKKVEHNLYFSVNEFFAMKEASRRQLINEASGVYRYIRPSNVIDGKYIIGMMEIYLETGQDVLLFREKQRYDGRFGGRPLEEKHDGYVFRKSDNIYIMYRESGTPENVKMCIMNKEHKSGGSIVTMSGVAMGVFSGARVYISSIFAERYDGPIEELEKEIGIASEISEYHASQLRGNLDGPLHIHL